MIIFFSAKCNVFERIIYYYSCGWLCIVDDDANKLKLGSFDGDFIVNTVELQVWQYVRYS